MAVVYITGVLDDGTTVQDPAVPTNPRVALSLTQGCSTTLRLSIVNPAGVPVPSTGTLVLTVKKRPQDYPPLATIAGAWDTSAGAGIAQFDIAPTTLQGSEWGRYCYDIRLSQGPGTQNLVIPTSPLLLLPAVSGVP